MLLMGMMHDNSLSQRKEKCIMKRTNDVVKGLKAEVKKNDEGKKKLTVRFDVDNKLGYDGCGTHTHK